MQRVSIGELQGQTVEAVTLASGSMRARLMTYGARLCELWVPDRDGLLADVVLGHDSLADYVASTAYFGATCGRYANRIRDGRLVIDGVSHALDRNEGSNSLHGGTHGFDRKNWQILDLSPDAVTFALTSPDGDMGYPGTCKATATYQLAEGSRLIVTMVAEVDRPSVVNMANHSYFNLAGQGNGSILGHRLQINAGHYTPVDAALIPTGQRAAVDGTAFDFRKACPINRHAALFDGVAGQGGAGYDTNWCIDRVSDGLLTVAELSDPASGRRMAIEATEPGIQVYTGGYLVPDTPGKAGRRIGRYGGVALETQKYPDSPNQPGFPSAMVRPGQVYRHEMVFAFSVDPA